MTRLLEINSCKKCPNVDIQRYWTSDSFETEFVWKCKENKDKVIGYADWRPSDQASLKIPKWCPLASKK